LQRSRWLSSGLVLVLASLSILVSPLLARAAPGVGYELFFNDKAVSGPETERWTREQALANCKESKTNPKFAQPGRRIDCRFDGVLLALGTKPGSVAAGPIEDRAAVYKEGVAAYTRGDYATAMRLWHPLADQGFASAQSNIGLMYAEGRGVARDHAAAANWFRKAAEQGVASAQNNLGLMYDNGQGVPQDHAAAMSWYRKAAEQGHASAQNNLGVMYVKGQGVAPDHAAAVNWFRKAAEQGNASAQYSLGLMYAKGQGVPQDQAAAASWYRKAADQGVANAQNSLGTVYFSGHGLPLDYVHAHAWFDLAAERGNKDAARNRDAVAAKMTPAQIAEAQKLAHGWKPRS
jgi:TPR repeat protein